MVLMKEMPIKFDTVYISNNDIHGKKLFEWFIRNCIKFMQIEISKVY